MVEVEDCFEAIKKLQRNFHSTIIDKMEESELFAMAKDWKGQFQYWALTDFEKVLDHILQNNKYFPKPSTFWAVKNEIVRENQDQREIVFDCGYCKDTGIRAYKDKEEIVHVCRCDCKMGLNHYELLPLMSEIKKQGLSEYRIHDTLTPFAFIPQGESFRLSREIAEDNKFMLDILEKAQKHKRPNFAGVVKQEMMMTEEDDRELPF